MENIHTQNSWNWFMYLISRVFLAWTFVKFLAHCDQDTAHIGGLDFLMKKLKENGYGLIPKGKKHALNKYNQFALNTRCFWVSARSNIIPSCVISQKKFTKIINKLIYYCCCWSKNFVKLHNSAVVIFFGTTKFREIRI